MHAHTFMVSIRKRRFVFNVLLALSILSALAASSLTSHASASSVPLAFPSSVNQAFSEASQRFGVPIPLLKAICYKEGRISQNAGLPNVDQGWGCMGLVKNSRVDMLDSAAQALGVNADLLKQNLAVNISGGAATLRADALQLSSNHTLPANLAGWYGAVAQYSEAILHSTALLYADAVYAILKQGFSVQVGTETVTLSPQSVSPQVATAAKVHTASTLPAGCTNDGKTDYPGAIDCIISPAAIYDCNVPTSPDDCSYTSSDRPNSCTVQTTVIQPCNIDQVVIHDTEGSLTDALNVFQCAGTGNTQCAMVSIHYMIDSDGTVYQLLREHDIAYQAGNFWYNEHSIGIEHVGFDATGYQWYNPAQYEASAKLTAYLLKKYHLPLDRAHVVAHGTVPSPTLASEPNHVDPGPYWLWDYYFGLISKEGVLFNPLTPRHTITLRPLTDLFPLGPHGTETASQYNFFKLYNGPSTASGIIPSADSNDPIGETYNVESEISYYYLDKARDPITGDTMYEIWYGEQDQLSASPPSNMADAHLAWLAVPPGDGVEGIFPLRGPTAVTIAPGNAAQIYGRPTTNSIYVVGSAPAGAIFTTAYTVTEDNAGTLWYEINFNHRQAWVPASEVAVNSGV